MADINIDMFPPIAPLGSARARHQRFHARDRAAGIAQSFGVKAAADPRTAAQFVPQKRRYNFIRHGIPSVIMDVFYETDSPESKTFKEWLTQRYHAPSDDVNQPVDLKSAALYEEIVRRLLIETANAAERPQWKSDSFFKRYAETQAK